MIINEDKAWKILSSFVNVVKQISPDTLIAVYAIGSLPGGYYKPGQSEQGYSKSKMV